jgi:hypothetical protein
MSGAWIKWKIKTTLILLSKSLDIFQQTETAIEQIGWLLRIVPLADKCSLLTKYIHWMDAMGLMR